jgi:hypothetical protein
MTPVAPLGEVVWHVLHEMVVQTPSARFAEHLYFDYVWDTWG